MPRHLLLWPLALAAGCLYTGERNQRPDIELSLSTSAPALGEMLTVYPKVTDDQPNDPMLYDALDYTLVGPDGPIDPRAPGCTADVAFINDRRALTATLYRPGSYTLSFSTHDAKGARSLPVSRTLTVVANPVRWSDGTPQALTVVTAKDYCMAAGYTAGEPVLLSLGSSTAVGNSYHAPSSCPAPPPVSYRWAVVSSPAWATGAYVPLLAPAVAGACAARAPSDAVDGTLGVVSADPTQPYCLYSASSAWAGIADQYQVSVVAGDGSTQSGALTATVAMPPDQPPCILGTSPLDSAQGQYSVIDRTAPQTLVVTDVSDDHDPLGSPNLALAWSLMRSSDGVWRPISGWNQPSYTLDPSGFDVGETVSVRVEADDGQAHDQAPACDPTANECTEDDDCAVLHGSCLRWVTWSFQLR